MSMCKMLGEPVLWLVSVSFPWGVQLRTTLVVREGGAYEDHYQVIASVFLDGVWYWFYSIGSDDAREHWGYIKFGFEDFEFPLWCHTGLQHFLDLLQWTLRALLIKIPILVRTLNPGDLHMDFNIVHAWLALLILVMVSLAQSPLMATILSIYTSFSVLLLVRIGLLLVIFIL